MMVALGLAIGWAADEVFGDPSTRHPVAGFGRFAAACESRLYADSRRAGGWYAGALVGAAAGLGAAIDRVTRDRPLLRVAATAAVTWTVLGGRTLRTEAAAVATPLAAGDLPAARRRVARIVGRDPDALDAPGIARATIETVAENTTDAVVAPLFWGAVAGPAGLLAYRAANTLDAMVGHRNPRYERFGWAAARLDDVLNHVPARLTAALALAFAAAPAVHGSRAAATRAIRVDAPAHPSPNGGVVEAAWAGILGVRLGGTNVYAGRREDRGTLGTGPAPEPADIARANRLSALVAAAAALVLAGLRAGARSGPHPSRRDPRRACGAPPTHTRSGSMR